MIFLCVLLLQIPLSYVSNCSTAKNEVTLEFHPNDDAGISMMEMRFYVPTDPNSEVDPVEAFKNNVISKAAIIQATGDAIANFSGVQSLTPRGTEFFSINRITIYHVAKTAPVRMSRTISLRTIQNVENY